MKVSGTFKISLFMSSLFISGCGNIALQLMGGSGTAIQGLTGSADGASFADRCGGKASELADPNHVIVEQYMKSTPIVVSGTKSDIAYKVTLQANVYIKASGAESIQETKVKVAAIDAQDDGRFSKAEAENAALDNSNRRTSWGMSTGLLLKLQKTDDSYKGIECAVGFTAKSKFESNSGTGVIAFDPGLPSAINPRASLETFSNELGTSRSFSAVAKIQQQAKDWAPVGTEAKVTSTFKKVSADIKSVQGAPADAPAVGADIAFEVTTSASGRDVTTLGLSKRQVFFINSKNKELVAVLDDSGRLNPIDNKPMAPVLIIMDQSK